jgi:glycosyltransferase involved in cell wall biosynthesis
MSDGELVDVLIPTFERPGALAVTLTTLGSQSINGFRVVVSDQGEERRASTPEVDGARRYVEARGNKVVYLRHLPRRGMAEQRQFLLDQAREPYVLYLDDDVICEPDLIERLLTALRRERCGFVGSDLIGLSYLDDVRPDQQQIELWNDRVQPELVKPGSDAWDRAPLHSAANLWHVQQRLDISREEARLYKVAWVGGCVMYDVQKLRSVGGFGFWTQLPETHVGEDVLAQLHVMARYGGAALIPSGAYHQELPTTLPEREVDAPVALPVN